MNHEYQLTKKQGNVRYLTCPACGHSLMIKNMDARSRVVVTDGDGSVSHSYAAVDGVDMDLGFGVEVE